MISSKEIKWNAKITTFRLFVKVKPYGLHLKIFLFVPLTLHEKSIFSANLDKLPSTPLTYIGIPFHFFFSVFLLSKK